MAITSSATCLMCPELWNIEITKIFPNDRYIKNVENYNELSSNTIIVPEKGKTACDFYNSYVHIIPSRHRSSNKSNPMNGYHYGSNLARDMMTQTIDGIGAHMPW